MRPIALLVCAAVMSAEEPVLTIYNGGFAMVRDRIAVDLKPGDGTISYAGASAHVQPGTAMIAVPPGVRVREHTYRNDPVSTSRLLQIFEGASIDVEIVRGEQREVRKARIVRAPASVHQEAWQRYGRRYAQAQQALVWSGSAGASEALLEIDGQLRFGLPGTPLFPALPAGIDLRPTLEWKVRAAEAVRGPAEIAYLCGGMSWEAAYTVVAEGEGEGVVALTGVLTVDNQSGADYRGARLKCVAGDVSRNADGEAEADAVYGEAAIRRRLEEAAYAGMEARADAKAFSDYHLYTLPDAIDLRDRETKQIGFIAATGVASRKRLVYDGLQLDWRRYRAWPSMNFRTERSFGTEWNPKVAVERVIANETGNQLGKPLPAGVVRCFLKDADGRPEFVGEDRIDHLPEGEALRIRTGNAFDVVGERVQTAFSVDQGRSTCSETFRIVVRNHRAQPAEVTVVEHLYRWTNWQIANPSQPWTKRDARTIEIPLTVPAKGEAVATYQAVYTW